MAAYMLCIDYFFVSCRGSFRLHGVGMLISFFVDSTATTDPATNVSHTSTLHRRLSRTDLVYLQSTSSGSSTNVTT
jgi:hypothetical protein